MVDSRKDGIKNEGERAKPELPLAAIHEKLIEKMDKMVPQSKDQTSQIVIILFGVIILCIMFLCIITGSLGWIYKNV